jgi:hypothetical protein
LHRRTLSDGHADRRALAVDGVEFGFVLIEYALSPSATIILRGGSDRVEIAVAADCHALIRRGARYAVETAQTVEGSA